MNTYEILRTQPRTENPSFTKMVMLHSITKYLLEKNDTNFIAILKPLGSLMKYYHIVLSPKSCITLKQHKTDHDILLMLPELIVSNQGYKNKLIPFLMNLQSHFNN